MTDKLSPGWQVFGATARGASHVRSGAPNQDYIGWLPATAGGAVAALAVSDGHGGKRYVNSHIGSRLSVEAALAEATDWLVERGKSLDDMADRIHGRWVTRVNETWDGASGDHLLEHGATMLVAALADGQLALCQIGDGDILVGRRSGAIERPLAEDVLEGEQTHSLCEADAPIHAHQMLLPVDGDDPIDFVMMSSDGLAKSFSDDESFFALGRHYHRLMGEKGLASIVSELPEWLSAASKNGSGDDISLGFIVSPALRPGAVPTPTPGAASATANVSPAREGAGPAPARGSLAIAGWVLLGALLATGAAIANPWRPWTVLPLPLLTPAKPATSSAPAETANPETAGKPVPTAGTEQKPTVAPATDPAEKPKPAPAAAPEQKPKAAPVPEPKTPPKP